MRMARLIGICAVIGAFALVAPLASGAKPDNPGSQGKEKSQGKGENRGKGKLKRALGRTCQLEARELGREEFRATYGDENGRRAMRGCKRANRDEIRNAAKDCKSERADTGSDAFRDKYGSNRNGKNAFGKCVVQHAQAEDSDSEETPES